MNELETSYNAAVKFYNKLADKVEEVYDEMKKNDEVKLSKKKIMEDYDLFIQSLLAIVAYSDGDVDKIELLFIKNISRYHNYFKKQNENDDLEINSLATDALNKVPLFMEMFASFEKEQMENGNELHLCKEAFDLLSKITNLLAGIDEKKENREIEKFNKVLEPLMKYLKRQGILI